MTTKPRSCPYCGCEYAKLPDVTYLILAATKVEGNQRALGRRLGISQQSISKWMRENHIPKKHFAALSAVAAELN